MSFGKSLEKPEIPSSHQPESITDKLEANTEVEKPDSVTEKEAAANYTKNIEKDVQPNMEWKDAAKKEGVFSDKVLDQIGSRKEYEIYKNANLKEQEINDKICLIRNDVDWSQKDVMGRTNKERIEQGLAPIKDGKPLELHHIGQHKDSPLAELTNKEHHSDGNDTILHDKNKDTEIDRNEFAKERMEHWKERAENLGGI